MSLPRSDIIIANKKNKVARALKGTNGTKGFVKKDQSQENVRLTTVLLIANCKDCLWCLSTRDRNGIFSQELKDLEAISEVDKTHLLLFCDTVSDILCIQLSQEIQFVSLSVPKFQFIHT